MCINLEVILDFVLSLTCQLNLISKIYSNANKFFLPSLLSLCVSYQCLSWGPGDNLLTSVLSPLSLTLSIHWL